MSLTPHAPPARRWATVAALALVVGLLGSCSSSGSSDRSSPRPSDDPAGSTTTSTKPQVKRPDGPEASFKELTGGKGIALLAANPGPDLLAANYTETEYSASGNATAYQATGDLPADGRFQLKSSTAADYATRMVVRRPADPKKFNGTVVVEWLNVSSGADIAPDYSYLAEELLRGGYAWVGVSAQRIGIEGGPVAVAAPAADITGAGKGIKTVDPARYGSLHHPGDAYSYDIYTQIGRGLRAAGAEGPLAGLRPKQVLADGESQSAFALTTYVDGVQPLTHAFDGFLIHSRGGTPLPLGKPDAGIDIADSLTTGKPTRIRTDLDVPVLMVQTETDVAGILGFLPARQPDTDRIRTWEMAGTAHADAFQVGAAESLLGCSTAINRGQQHFVVAAALRSLDRWAAGGEAPPKAPRLAIDESGKAPTLRLDAVGNAEGGIRTPAVDAPLDMLSGLPGTDSSVICILFGRTTALSPDVVAKEFPTRQAYLDAYTKAANSAIKAGFVLPEDRKALLAEAQPDRVAA